MKFFEASIGTMVIRLFLLMAIVIGAGFSGQWWLALFALPVFLSAMSGTTFTSSKKPKKKAAMHSVINPENKNEAA